MNNDDLVKISQLLDEKLKPVHNELKNHVEILKEQGETLKQHGKILRSLKKDQNTILKVLDREQMMLGLSSAS